MYHVHIIFLMKRVSRDRHSPLGCTSIVIYYGELFFNKIMPAKLAGGGETPAPTGLPL